MKNLITGKKKTSELCYTQLKLVTVKDCVLERGSTEEVMFKAKV